MVSKDVLNVTYSEASRDRVESNMNLVDKVGGLADSER
jgi:hypothetical protein